MGYFVGFVHVCCSVSITIIMQETSLLKDQGIRIWSYNVFLRPPPIKNNNDDYKMERFNLIVDRIHLYDIICFQQLFQTGSFRMQDMIAAGISKGFQYWAISQPCSFFGPIPVDSGLVVLSKYPILESVFSDSSSDKGYIYCKISVNGAIMHLFNIHLQASYLTSEKSSYHKELSLAARRHQANLLKQQIKVNLARYYKQGDLILVIGDFNINAHDQKQCLSRTTLVKAFIKEQFHQYEQFVALMEGKFDEDYVLDKHYKFRDLLLQNYGYHPTTYGEQALMVLTHKDQYGIPQRLDYIFQIQVKDEKLELIPILSTCLIQKAKVEGQPFTQLSDHYGITLKIMPSVVKQVKF